MSLGSGAPAARVDDGFELAGLLARLQRFFGFGEGELAGDQDVQVHLAVGDQLDGQRPGVGVAEDAGEPDFAVLDVGDGQFDVVGPEPDQDDPAGRAHGFDAGTDGLRGAGGVDEGIDVEPFDAVRPGVEGMGGAVFQGEGEPVFGDVA